MAKFLILPMQLTEENDKIDFLHLCGNVLLEILGGGNREVMKVERVDGLIEWSII